MATAPIFAPDGTLGDIPVEQLPAAIKAGAKPGVNFKAPDGSMGVIPADKIQDAYKAGGKLVPFEQQEASHPGFWDAVKSYMGDSSKVETEADKWKRLSAQPMIPPAPTPQEDAQRKAAGFGPTYRALVRPAEMLGMNVKGAEQAAQQGDVAGVAGYAAVPAAAAIGSAAIGALRGKPPAGPAPAVPQPTPSPFTPEQQAFRAKWAARGGALAPEPIDRAELTRNQPQIGTRPMPSSPPSEPQQFTPKPEAPADALGKLPVPAKPTTLQQAAALKQPVHDIVDSAIPPTGTTKASNLLTKSRIDFQLQRGNVDAAQAILDSAKPSPAVKGESRIVPSVQNIRENDAMVRDAESQPDRVKPNSRADLLDDKATQQEMNWDLERKGWQVESEARREFIARNSTGATKGSLVQDAKAKLGVGQAAPTPADADLLDILQKSLEMAKKGKR